jgi:hypothetical protein
MADPAEMMESGIGKKRIQYLGLMGATWQRRGVTFYILSSQVTLKAQLVEKHLGLRHRGCGSPLDGH